MKFSILCSNPIKINVMTLLAAVMWLPFGSMTANQLPPAVSLLTVGLLASLPVPGLNLEDSSMRVDHPVHSGKHR